MMGSDMDDDVVDRQINRRKWLAHCTVTALALRIAPALAAPAAGAKGKGRPLVLVVGDSLSAEYGLARGSGWVALLEKRLVREGVAASVVNASISGDTTSGGRSRLAALLKLHQPSIVVLELGANDALRGLPLTMSRDNLAQMATAARQAGAKVLIVGMQVPPNYGRKYSDEFAALFADVARAQGAALLPFLLKGVADVPNAEAMFQADRIHPRAEAHPTILANIWPVLRPLLG
jgi:acyl-CoA thioesterase I